MNALSPWRIIAWCLVGLAWPAFAATRAFFTSQTSVEKELIGLIGQTRSSIDMALFRFDSRPLEAAIHQANARGVRIRMILDGHPEADHEARDLAALLPSGQVRRLDGKHGGTQGIMHHKFVLFDARQLVTGSFNWTAGAEHRNYENALLIDSVDTVRAYQSEFDILWSHATPLPPSATGQDLPAPKYSAHRRSATRKNTRVKKAHKSHRSKKKSSGIM